MHANICIMTYEDWNKNKLMCAPLPHGHTIDNYIQYFLILSYTPEVRVESQTRVRDDTEEMDWKSGRPMHK